MPNYRVTCIRGDGSDPDYRIDGIGGESGGGWYLPIDEAIYAIEHGQHSFYTREGDKGADIVVEETANGVKFLRTAADSFKPNNLLKLPECPS